MQKKSKIRALFIISMLTLCFAALIGRVYWLQVVNASELMVRAQSIWEKSRQLIPARGTIYDRNDKVLAQDAISYIVSVNPRLIHEKGLEDEVVEVLAPILEMTSPEKRQKLYEHVTAKRDNGRYYVQREIRNEGWKIEKAKGDQIKRAIEDHNLYGTIHLEESYKRYYPAEDTAAHVLGYVNMEGEPVSGLESHYNDYLSGVPGEIQYEQDAKGYELPGATVTYKPAQDGKSLRLTIDENIQLYIEEAMKTAYEKYRPSSMSAIAVDPNTLEILGMANLPNFNPNSYWDFESFQDFNNFGIVQAFEPGSTFKVFTLAAAVEEGVFDPDEMFQSGGIRVPGGQVRDHNWSGWGEITFLDGLKRSSNVAFVELGYNKLGSDKLLHYLQQFGFGTPSGVDLPSEAKGRVSFRYPLEVANASFGQGITVTALQQVTAISAIANGGNLLKPYIVSEIIDPETEKVLQSFKPESVRRVLNEEAAEKTSLYLEQVIADQEIGTGSGAYLDGYRVAGKTGTAQKVIDGAYSNERYVISFIGYAPVEDPQIALIVTADDPNIDGDYRLGSGVVVPVFKEIMLQSLRYLGVSKQETSTYAQMTSWLKEVPDVEGESLQHAMNLVKRKGLEAEVIGSGNKVIGQHPQPETELAGEGKVFLITSNSDEVEVPDLSGLALRDALQVCMLIDLECVVDGEGHVISQQLQYTGNKRSLKLQLAPRSIESEEQEEDATALTETP